MIFILFKINITVAIINLFYFNEKLNLFLIVKEMIL